jgi:hypothetical protein
VPKQQAEKMSTHMQIVNQSPLVYKRGKRLRGWHARSLVLLADGSLVSHKQGSKDGATTTQSPALPTLPQTTVDLGTASHLIDDADIEGDGDESAKGKKNKVLGKGPVVTADTVISPVQYRKKDKLHVLTVSTPDVSRRVYSFGWKSEEEANRWMDLLQRLHKQKKVMQQPERRALLLKQGQTSVGIPANSLVTLATATIQASVWEAQLHDCRRSGDVDAVIKLPNREWGRHLFASAGLSASADNNNAKGPGSRRQDNGGLEVARGLAGLRVQRSFREFAQAVVLWWVRQPLESRDAQMFVGGVRFKFVHSEQRKLPPAQSVRGPTWQHVSGITKGTQAFLLGSDVLVHGTRCTPPLFPRHETGLRSEQPPLVCVLHAGDLVCIATASAWIKEEDSHDDDDDVTTGADVSNEDVSAGADVRRVGKHDEEQFPILPRMMHVSLSSWEDPSHAQLVLPTMRRHTISACRAVVLRPQSTVEQGIVRRIGPAASHLSHLSQSSSSNRASQSNAKEPLWMLDIDLSKSQTVDWVTQVMAALEIEDVRELCGFRDVSTGVLFYYSHRSTMQACNIPASHLAGCKLFGPVLVMWPTFPFPYLRPETIRLMPHVVDAYANAKSQSSSQSFIRHARIATLECDTVLLQRAVQALITVPLLDGQLAAAPPRGRLLLGDSSQVHMYLRAHGGLSTHRMSVASDAILTRASQLTRAIGLVSAIQTAVAVADQALVVQLASAVKGVLALRLARARRTSVEDGNAAPWERSAGAGKPR